MTYRLVAVAALCIGNVTAVGEVDELTGPQAEQLLAEVHAAIEAGDARRFTELVELPAELTTGSAPSPAEVLFKAPAEARRSVTVHLEGLRWRSVDRYLRYPGSTFTKCPSDAVRVIFERIRPGASPPDWRRMEVRAFLFVERGGQWKWYWLGGVGPWCPWDYSFDTAEAAYRSLVSAIEGRDYRTVHELIDPELRPAGMGRDEWLAITHERVAALDRAEEAGQQTDAAAGAQGQPPLQAVSARYVAIGQHGANSKARFVDDTQTVARVSHLWDQADKLKGPVPYETFVKRGTRWYWQPKPEYTLWPRTGDRPASQPASQPATTQPASGPTSQPEEKAKSGK